MAHWEKQTQGQDVWIDTKTDCPTGRRKDICRLAFGNPDNDKNANLIANAPQLLESLEVLIGEIESCQARHMVNSFALDNAKRLVRTSKNGKTDTPLEWAELWAEMRAMESIDNAWVLTTRNQFDESLGCVPPAAIRQSSFLVGEPSHERDGETVYAAFTANGCSCFARYMTTQEFYATF